MTTTSSPPAILQVRGAAKRVALQLISEHLMPGRWAEIREPSRKELAATSVLALPLAECSVKVSKGPPDDQEIDLDRAVWAGTVPIHESFGEPVDAPDLVNGVSVPTYVRRWER